jgi:hypothetical protein
VDAAVGVAVHPDHGTDPEILLQRADLATHAAKQLSVPVQMFHPSLESRSAHRLGLAADLRRAIELGEIEVYFQPKVTLVGRRVIGVECLARWEHPAHGTVAPVEFVAVAEHTGQLGRLTEVVLREALRRCRGWLDEGRPLPVAINISPRTLVDMSFPTQVGHHARGVPRPRHPAHPGDHRGRHGGRDGSPAAGPAQAQRDGRTAGRGRLRHRLLVLSVPAEPAGARSQDRPFVRPGMATDPGRSRHRAGRGGPVPATSGSPRSPRAWRAS